RDLPSLYGISDVQELNSLFTTLAYNTGNEVSLEALTKASGVDKYQLRKYLEYLEAAFFISIVHRVDDNSKRFKRANFFKIFLTNPSLRSALFAPVSATDEFMGNLVETTIFSQWMHRDTFTPYYARWNSGEVDMVGLDIKRQRTAWAVEIKWSDRYFRKPGDLKSLLLFCKKNDLNSALSTTVSKDRASEVGDVELLFVPSAIYAYMVGKNTLERKRGNEEENFEDLRRNLEFGIMSDTSDFYCDEVFSGRTPVDKVSETENVLAYHHTRPFWPVHIVVVPKRHIASLLEADDESLLELFAVIKQV